MAQHLTPFGRRNVRAPLAPAPQTRAIARPSPAPRLALSPEAEAFRAALADGAPTSSSFARWNSSSRRKLTALWALRVGLMAPGLVGFAIHLPAAVSVGLELAGLLANGWLRRERRRHRAAILAWEEDI